MKRLFWLAALGLILSGCGGAADTAAQENYAMPETTAAMGGTAVTTAAAAQPAPAWDDAVYITLEGSKASVGFPAGNKGGVEQALEEIRDCGENPGEDHVCAEDDISVMPQTLLLTVTKPGIYVLSGWSDAARVAVELGEKAGTDSEAVVTLVLNGVDMTCTGGAAIDFVKAYECGDPTLAGEKADTSAAGANIEIADGTENLVTGGIRSAVSVNIGGSGALRVSAEGEGIVSGLHLTVNGGDISILSGGSGIRADYSGVSVISVNGGRMNLTVTQEGSGIASAGWLVVNGGRVVAAGREAPGLAADMELVLNGGTAIATGTAPGSTGGTGNFGVFQFAEDQSGGSTFTLKNGDGKPVLNTTPFNDFSCLLLAGEGLSAGEYTLWRGQTRLAGAAGQENRELPAQAILPEIPKDMTPPEEDSPKKSDEDDYGFYSPEISESFPIEKGGNYFSRVADVTQE